MGSIVLCGYGFGSLIWVPFQTYFVNPDNLQAVPDPDCDENVTVCDRYYTDPELLARVPWMFLISGAIYAVLGVLAVTMISDPKLGSKQESSLEQLEFKKEEYQGKDGLNLKPTEVLRTKTFYKVLYAYTYHTYRIEYRYLLYLFNNHILYFCGNFRFGSDSSASLYAMASCQVTASLSD